MKKKSKRLVVISDFHCGHEVGLTPTQWNPDPTRDAMSEYRAYMWRTVCQEIDRLRPIDIVVANGDLIDGRSERTGGNDLIVLDRLIQCDMAAVVIRRCDAGKTYILRGTDYHVGYDESYEDLVSEKVGAERVGDVMNIDVNGLMFNFRHHIGGSQTPIGRTTPLLRESVWNALWNVRKGFPLADVIVRSHVHYCAYVGGPDWLAMTTPGLQGYGTRHGERRLSGIIDWGVTVFDVTNRRDFSWAPIVYPFPYPEPAKA